MEFVCCREYAKNAIDGPMRIAVGAKVVSESNVLVCGGKRICFATSQNCYDHFARNDDGKGKKRFSLTHGILRDVAEIKIEYEDAVAEVLSKDVPADEKREAIAKIDDKPTRFFSAVYEDPVFSKYLTNGAWNLMFYYAGIDQLERLRSLMAKVIAGA